MKHIGKYIYGIIQTEDDQNFGPIGISNTEVITIGKNGVAACISNSSLDHYVISQENLSRHMNVIEKIGENYTILPMRFCTVSDSTEEIIAFLEDNRRDLKNLLRDMEGKVEITIKITWKKMKEIYDELIKENKNIRKLKESGTLDQRGLVHAGELVETALNEKKAVEGDEYLRPLKKIALKFKEGKIKEDNNIVNASFLVDKDWIKEFDNLIEKISKDSNERIDIKYIGPMPIFSFVDLTLHWNS
jgi:hypothetical protein